MKNLKIKKKDYHLDPYLWRLVAIDGFPVAALYFNGREFSLSQEHMEGLTKVITEYCEEIEKGEPTDSGCGHNHT